MGDNTAQNNSRISIKEVSQLAQQKLGDALELKPNATTSIQRDGEDWKAVVEVLEEEYLPGKGLRSMNDIIGVYEVLLSKNGELLSWTKKAARKRGGA